MQLLPSDLGFSTRCSGHFRSVVLLLLCSSLLFSSCEFRPLVDPEEQEQEDKASGEDASGDDSDSDGGSEEIGNVDTEWNQGPEFGGEL